MNLSYYIIYLYLFSLLYLKINTNEEDIINDVTIDEYTSSKYDIKGVQIGKYHSSWGHIDVHKYTRKLKKIVLVIDVSEEDKKNPELFQSSLEAYLKTFLGDKYHKIIEYGWGNDIECVWDDNYNIGCGVKTWVVPGSKTAGITIGKGIKYKGIE